MFSLLVIVVQILKKKFICTDKSFIKVWMTSLGYNDAMWSFGKVIFYENKCISHTIQASINHTEYMLAYVV